MKGIILAGGKGTRLYPLTLAVSKQALPLYSKPMIYYPISILMLAGIREILVISMPEDLPVFKRLLGTGEQWGIQFSYAEQDKPRGLADAYNVASDFVTGESSLLCLGDNVFFSHDLVHTIKGAIKNNEGATVFAYEVKDPDRYGIVEIDDKGKTISLEEKPKRPKSNLAVPGLYIYDERVMDIVRTLKPSARGELEITDVNRAYLERGLLKVVRMGRGTAWLDAGTPESLMQASNFIQAVEERQGLMVACLEEIAFGQGWISKAGIQKQCELLAGSKYAEYLRTLLERA